MTGSFSIFVHRKVLNMKILLVPVQIPQTTQ